MLLPQTHPPPLSRSRVIQKLRIAFVAYFTAFFVLDFVSANVEFFGIGGCNGLSSPHILVITYGNIFSAFVALLFFVKVLGKFRDRFRFHVELRRIAIVYGSYLPFAVVVMMLGEYELIFRTVAYFCQISFVVSGVLPLLEQRRLDQKVRNGNFEDVENFEDILNDGVALVALEKFMQREFCDEMLAFYRTFDCVFDFVISFEFIC